MVNSFKISFSSFTIFSFSDEELLYDLTTPEPPSIGYSLRVKIVDLGENFHTPHQGTVEYDDLSNTINENFKPIFTKIQGYKKLTIEDLQAYVFVSSIIYC